MQPTICFNVFGVTFGKGKKNPSTICLFCWQKSNKQRKTHQQSAFFSRNVPLCCLFLGEKPNEQNYTSMMTFHKISILRNAMKGEESNVVCVNMEVDSSLCPKSPLGAMGGLTNKEALSPLFFAFVHSLLMQFLPFLILQR